MLPPQNFGRWDVFIAVQNKNRRRAVFFFQIYRQIYVVKHVGDADEF
jgi:hypothetical protein